MSNIDDRGVDLAAVRARLGRTGVWLGPLGRLSAARARAVAARVEELGYSTLWVTESQKEAFAHAGTVLAATSRLTVATGIANVWARGPETTVSGANALDEAWGGRFVLGLGIGHAKYVADYTQPFATMRTYLEQMHATRLQAPTPPEPTPWLVAALGPKMLELAARLTQGTHPYFVPVEHTARARSILGPAPILAPEVAVVLDTSPSSARATARQYMETYLGLPNYTSNLRRLGFTDDDLSGGGSDRLVDAIVPWGSTETIARRVAEHVDAGADHVCVQPLGGSGDAGIDDLAELAPALLG